MDDHMERQAIRCPGCRGRGTVTGQGPDGYSTATGAWYPTGEIEACDECEGHGNALCPGCKSESVDVQDLGSGRYYCTPCWLRTWNRDREESRLQRQAELDVLPIAAQEPDWSDLPF